jgi:DNA helicase HerA-like ATPase
VKIAPPTTRVGPLTDAELQEVQESSPVRGKYDTPLDRESAFEILQGKAQGRTSGAPVGEKEEEGGILSQIGSSLGGLFKPQKGRMSVGQAAVRSAATSVARTVGNAIAREIVRGITGAIK